MDHNLPLSLEAAAEKYLGGYVKAATLRAAASRGELTVMKLGRRYLVTPSAVREWMELCQEKQKARVSGSGQQQPSKPPCGLSETDHFSAALAAAKARVTRPKESLVNISGGSTIQPGVGDVLLKFQSRT